MNAQRWIALGAVIGIIACIATSNLWLVPFASEDEEEDPQEIEVEEQAVQNQAENTDLGPALQTPTPTLDPAIEELNAFMDTGQLAVGNEPFIVYTGVFNTIDAEHQGEGRADIYKLGTTEQFILRLENFSISNGPDLQVILSRHGNPFTSADALLSGYLDLGSLRSSSGAQNYEIAPGSELEDYGSVVIYSQSLNLIYTRAVLEAVRGG